MLTGDGKSLSVLKTVILMTLNGRKHWLESFVDISRRERAEEELKRRSEEVQIAKDAAEKNAAQLTRAFNQLNSVKEDLERFNKADIGREMRIIEVKHEVNTLLSELGRRPKYKVTEKTET